MFERQARRTPEVPAVADSHGLLTYGELDRRAEALAAFLRSKGVRPDRAVGIYMEHCAEYVGAMLAALKAGGAYLPIELAYPDALVRDVISDSEPRVVLTEERHAHRLPEDQTRLCLDGDWEKELPEGLPEENAVEPGPDDLCFVAYSSGTTGRPKGIANPHRAAVGSYLWRFGVSDCGPGEQVGCNVFFTWEVLRPLLRGGTSIIIPDEVIYDPALLIAYLAENRVTETLMTPSLLEAVLVEGGPDLAGRLPELKTLWLNGEVVTRRLTRGAMDSLPHTRLLNVYSISETHEVAAGDLRELVENEEATYCPVGRPVDRDRLYVVDEEGNSLPRGKAGELYVGGDLLARGYVGLPEKTAERFVEDTFSDGSGARMYRSGDRARLLSDGSLEVLGRVDSMQKVRGYSIGVGAVETAIRRNVAVNNCVATVEGEEGGDKRLVAYIVPALPENHQGRHAGWSIDERTGNSPGIREVLREVLPHYMIPAAFVEIESLPLHEATGKVDRNRLPAPPARSAGGSQIVRAVSGHAPRSEKEAAMAGIWAEVLGLDAGDVSADEDFFELGGHSLAAAELLGRVEDAFGERLAVAAFLRAPTVTGLLDSIEAKGRDETGAEAASRDLSTEAVLDEDIAPEGPEGWTALRDARRVFLTGATGFLGAFILDGLLRRTNAKVYCLLRPREESDWMAPIRANLHQYGLWRPGRERRIVPVTGRLGEPLLGMAGEDFNALARGVDVIFHAGAMVNLIYPYENLKAPNVLGTQEVLRLACRHKTKPLHHVSTSGVFPPGRRLCTEDAPLDSLAGAREDGYGQSKWVGEKLVRQAEERGLPVSVYRPGNISGHGYSGASNARDFITALMVGAIRLGSAPEMSGWMIEMTPVDFVSGAILEISDRPREWGQTFHLANPERVSAGELFGWLEEIGYPMERLNYSEWLKEWRSGSNSRKPDDAIGSILHGAGPEAPEIRDHNTYDDRNTRHALRDSGLFRPNIDASLLENYARYFALRGWIPGPPNSSLRRSPA